MNTSVHGGADITLPHDHDAERWTIGSLIIDPTVAPEVFAIVQPDDFSDELGQAAAHVIHRTWKAGEPIDVLLVVQQLRRTNGDLGDFAANYLMSVAEESPTAANAAYYARRVATAASRRKCVELALQVLHDANDRDITPDAIVERVLSDAPNIVTCAQLDVWAKWEASLTETNRRLFYNVAAEGNQLNRIRISPGRVTVIGGMPGAGKTLLAAQLVLTILQDAADVRAFFANCEMDFGEIMDRSVARLAQIPYAAVRDRKMDQEQLRLLAQAANELRQLKSRIGWMKAPFTMGRVRALVASHKADIVVIDYLQRFKVSDSVTDYRMQVSDCMSIAREIAQSGPAVVMLSALSRGGEFRESSEVEFAADYAYKLEVDEEDPTQVLCRYVKGRNDARRNIELTMDHTHQEVLAPDEEEAPSRFTEFDAYRGVPA